MKNKYIAQSMIVLIGCLIELSFFACYDQTFKGYGNVVAYQGSFVDVLLDPNAITNEGPTLSPYGIVTIGNCFFNSTALPNYPTLGLLPCISRFNRDGTPDTNFGNYFPGTGSYTFDASTNMMFPNFFNNSSQYGKLVYMNQLGSSPTYFVVYRSGSPETSCMIYKYMPLTGRIDYNLSERGVQNVPLIDGVGNPITATITSACTVPISGTAQTSAQTTANIYITYYDAGGSSYIAALKYSTTTNLFTYDTTFNSPHGALEYVSSDPVYLTSINYDSSANSGAGALIVAGSITGPTQVLIARFTMAGALDTTFNNGNGYARLAAPGGTTPGIISQFIFSKIVSTGTHYYYLSGWNAGGQNLDVCSFNPSTVSFGALSTVSTVVSGDNYEILDMVQIPDFSNTNAVAVAIGENTSGTPTLAGIIDFQFESPTHDLAGHTPVVLTEVNSLTALGTTGLHLSFISCLFDPSLYVASPTNLPGIFVGGNFGSPACGCFINYTYSSSSHTMIPAVGVRIGTSLFDYVNSEYSNGFSFEQVFYSAVDGTASYYISGQAQDYHPYSYPGIFRFNIANNSFNFTL